MTKKKTQKRINQTEGLIGSAWDILREILIDIAIQFKDLGVVFWKNIKGPWGKTWKRKLATIIVIAFTVYPLSIHYASWGKDFWVTVSNKIEKNEILEEVQTNYEIEIRDFFEEYNRKYSVDCDWVRRVNVDQNMFLKYGTTKKPGNGCLTTEKWQWTPVSIEKPLKDESNQIFKVRGKAVLVISDGGVIKAIEKNNFELWRKWEDDFWRFNPINGKQKYTPL